MPAPAIAGLYVHVPFCSAICPYCDFSVLTGGPAARAGFVERLVAEAALVPPGPWSFDTVYLGGGTPSALAPEQLARILEALRARFAIDLDARVFLEANPEDATPEALAALRSLGVNTLSLGVQSFNAAELAFLGRRHDPLQARAAVEAARAVGFDTVSVDLIFGLPGQDEAAWRRTLDEAVRLAPDHVSCYQLTIHEGTPFGVRAARGRLAELPEGSQADLFLLTHRLLADAGWPAYEVSNFARGPEHRSRHNVKYWDHTPYLGLGPSAHSFDGVRRFWNERRLGDWEARIGRGERPVAGEETLGARELALEALMLGLRTVSGLDLDRFRERYGVDLEATNGALLARLAEEGLLVPAGRRLAPTLAGLAVADGLASGFDLE